MKNVMIHTPATVVGTLTRGRDSHLADNRGLLMSGVYTCKAPAIFPAAAAMAAPGTPPRRGGVLLPPHSSQCCPARQDKKKRACGRFARCCCRVSRGF